MKGGEKGKEEKFLPLLLNSERKGEGREGGTKTFLQLLITWRKWGGKEQIGERVGVYGLFGFEAGTSLNVRQRKGGRPKM